MSSDRWTATFLDSMRQQGDELADSTAQAIFQSGELRSANALFGWLVSEDGVPATQGIPELESYLQQSAQLPEWADEKQIRKGEEIFLKWGPEAIVVLAGASLPECYVMRTIAKVLGETQKLEDHVERRVRETAQMVLDVMSPAGLVGAGPHRGILAAQKVRLMHASVRHLILGDDDSAQKPGLGRHLGAMDWDRETDGYPINQEDLAVTLMTFSHVILRGWEDLGIGLRTDEKEAYVHTWNVVGHIMGVHQDLLPLGGPEEAATLFNTIKARQKARTDDGQALTASLIAFWKKMSIPPRILTLRLPEMLMRELLGEETADMLGVPRLSAVDRATRRVLLVLARAFNFARHEVYHHVDGVGHIAGWVSGRLLRHLFEIPRMGNRQPFQLPGTLSSNAPGS